MIKYTKVLAFVSAFVCASAVLARAQQPTAPPTSNASPSAQPANQAPLTPLNVQVVISKYQGEKKVSSSPYTLAINANENKQAELSSVIQVLIPMVTVNEKTTGPVYDVATVIRSAATTMDAGRFKLEWPSKTRLCIRRQRFRRMVRADRGFSHFVPARR